MDNPRNQALPSEEPRSQPKSQEQVSCKTFAIAGLLTDIYGLEELPQQYSHITCIWALYGRTRAKDQMTPFAQETVFRWTATTNASSSAGRRERGVIVAAFDQRNHRSRLVSEVANKDWWTGNDRFGMDLFSSFNGTASDVSNFIVHIEAYIDRKIDKHLVAGLSLGGHAAWHVLLHEPRVSDGVVFIGCGDYIRLMSARAKHAELPSWTSGDPAGSMFLGSKDFPPSMVKAVSDLDPAALLMGCMFPQHSFLAGRTAQDWTHELSEEEKKTLVPLMRKTLGGNRILNLSGGEDLFVPHEASVPFLSWLEAAIRPGG